MDGPDTGWPADKQAGTRNGPAFQLVMRFRLPSPARLRNRTSATRDDPRRDLQNGVSPLIVMDSRGQVPLVSLAGEVRGGHLLQVCPVQLPVAVSGIWSRTTISSVPCSRPLRARTGRAPAGRRLRLVGEGD